MGLNIVLQTITNGKREIYRAIQTKARKHKSSVFVKEDLYRGLGGVRFTHETLTEARMKEQRSSHWLMCTVSIVIR